MSWKTDEPHEIVKPQDLRHSGAPKGCQTFEGTANLVLSPFNRSSSLSIYIIYIYIHTHTYVHIYTRKIWSSVCINSLWVSRCISICITYTNIHICNMIQYTVCNSICSVYIYIYMDWGERFEGWRPKPTQTSPDRPIPFVEWWHLDVGSCEFSNVFFSTTQPPKVSLLRGLM